MGERMFLVSTFHLALQKWNYRFAVAIFQVSDDGINSPREIQDGSLTTKKFEG